MTRTIKLTRLPRDKDAQVDITVREMIAITIGHAFDKDVHWLVNHARLAHYDQVESADAFYQFVKSKIRFELDPEDIELLRTPSYYARHIRRGLRVSGDCDDMALLLGTMFWAQGIPVAYVVMATSPQTREFRHVFVAGKIRRPKGWKGYDPSVDRPYETTGLRQKWYYVPYGPGPPNL